MKTTIIIDDKAIKDALDEITTKLQEIQKIAGTLGWNNIKVVFTSEQEKEPPVKTDGVEELALKVLKSSTKSSSKLASTQENKVEQGRRGASP